MTATLAIDTSTSRTIVALFDGDTAIFEKFIDGATNHGFALSQLAAEALASGIRPNRVVVGMGPGPFTGLRVGIAFAQSFALAREIPVIGICSLDAIVLEQDEYTVAIDARRKEIFWARYKNGVRVEGPAVSKPDDVPNFILDCYPDMRKLVALADSQNITEPIYLRRPDAIPLAEHR